MKQATDRLPDGCSRLARGLALVACALLLAACPSQVPGQNGLDGSDPAGPDWDPDDGTDGDDFDCGAATFTLTESQESFQVPENVVYMKVKAWGAGGNGESNETCENCPCTYSDGGLGGYSEAIFAIAPGTTLSVVVGQRGRRGVGGDESPFRYGFGAHGGGGLTGIFTGADEVTQEQSGRALIIAGGGGSAGWDQCRPGGTGNHPDAGGQSTMHGQFGLERDGDRDGINGGGGGYVGGNGGDYALPARGGQGFIADEGLEPLSEWAEPGDVVAPNSDDPDYDDSFKPGITETPGLLVVQFACEYPGNGTPPEDPPQVD